MTQLHIQRFMERAVNGVLKDSDINSEENNRSSGEL
jgi:hypothetical protein